jgi:hypothetical protein
VIQIFTKQGAGAPGVLLAAEGGRTVFGVMPCDSSAMENTLSNANARSYKDSHRLIFKPKFKIFLTFP